MAKPNGAISAAPDSNLISVNIKSASAKQMIIELDPDWSVQQVKQKILSQVNKDDVNYSLRLIFAGKDLTNDIILSQCDIGQNSVLHAVYSPLDIISSTSTLQNISEVVNECHNKTDVKTKPLGTTAIADVAPSISGQADHHSSTGQNNDHTPSSDGKSNDHTSANDSQTNHTTSSAGQSNGRARSNLLCDPHTVVTIQLSQEEQKHIQKMVSNAKGKKTDKPHFYVYCTSPCASLSIGKLRVRCLKCKQGAVNLCSDPTCWNDVLKPKSILCECETCSSDQQSYAEFFFKCADHITTGEDDTAVPLHMIRTNLRDAVCLSCGETSSPVCVFECEASHVACLDCFITYCLSKHSERQFTYDSSLGYTLPCPLNCSNSLISETHHFRLLGKEQYDRYQIWGAEEAVIAEDGVFCPFPGCGNGIIPEDLAKDCRLIVCSAGCGGSFCRLCLKEYHEGDCWTPDSEGLLNTLSRSVFPSNHSSVSGWDMASEIKIHTLTKPCPKCKTPTEKSGGCMHMVCTRASCRYNWCWVCHTEWTRDCMASHWFD